MISPTVETRFLAVPTRSLTRIAPTADISHYLSAGWLAISVLTVAGSGFQADNPAYGVFNWIDARKLAGPATLAFVLFGICALIVSVAGMSSPTPRYRTLLVNSVALLSVAVISVLYQSRPLDTGVRTVFIYIRPLLAFQLAACMIWSKPGVGLLVRVLKVVWILNVAAGFWQWLVLGYTEDFVQGIMEDCVTFS